MQTSSTTVRVTYRNLLGSFGAGWELLLDDEVVGKVYPSETVEFAVPPGRHRMRAQGGLRWWPGTSNTIAFEAGPEPILLQLAQRDFYQLRTLSAVVLFGRLSRHTGIIVLAISLAWLLLRALLHRAIPPDEWMSLREVEAPPAEPAGASAEDPVSAYVRMMDVVDPRR